MYKKISELLYDYFVINSYAAAVQQPDGCYITKYFPVSPFVLEEMLKQHGSMGCYQQGYKNGMIKWICFDFDSPDKENADINTMFRKNVVPFLDILNELSINYLTEYSGRRGIHVWIIFDTILSKKIGFNIMSELKKRLQDVTDILDIHIDYFPATDTSRGNVVGKQVKFPLSWHKKGTRSFFFKGEYASLNDCVSEEFLNSQLEILSDYVPNKLEYVTNTLELEEIGEYRTNYKYKKYDILGNIQISLENIEIILSETTVYRNIFERMKKGQAMREDWTVLLGTLAYCDNSGVVIRNLFSTFPNYDVEKTLKNIEKVGDRYFPATFDYLYKIYSLIPEDEINLSETGLTYLLRKSGCEASLIEKVMEINEHKSTGEIQYTLIKEKNYLMNNDEVPDVLIWNRLSAMKNYDLMMLEQKVKKIEEGDWEAFSVPKDFIVYKRVESEEKQRKMVSLSCEDRILTTHAMLQLQTSLSNKCHSFSYNVSPCSKSQVFYTWYSSWLNYITRVQTFLEIPFLHNYHVFVMDLKGFYDHIDFLAVYKLLENNLGSANKNIMQFLIAYNENIMKTINDGVRCGVPQGPAYARVIAEVFLDNILQTIFDEYDRSKFIYYRYVDDIVVYFKPEFDGKALYHDLENRLLSYGLPLNYEKSCMFGSIKDLSENEKKQISHSDKFSYELHISESDIIFEEEQNRRIRNYLMKNEFDMSVVSYMFGRKVFPKATELYYKSFAENIFSQIYGRGSYFKRFYNYLLKEEGFAWNALLNDYFSKIPLDTLNFSNFVHCLYLSVQSNGISQMLFQEIQQKYLNKIKDSITNERDASVVAALLLL